MARKWRNRVPAGGLLHREQRRDRLFVGLGASADGTEPLVQFLAHLPANVSIVLFVVQQLEPHHPRVLVDLLARHASMPVTEPTDGARPQMNHVYVVAPNASLMLEHGTFKVTHEGPAAATPIDTLFCSLAAEKGKRAAGVTFVDTGQDGGVGLRAIKERGGIALAHVPDAEMRGNVCRSVTEAGVADYVQTPEQLAARLLERVDRGADRKSRIRSRSKAVAHPTAGSPSSARGVNHREQLSEAGPAREFSPTVRRKASVALGRLLLREYAVPAAVVNECGDIIFATGGIDRLFERPTASLPTNLIDAVPCTLRSELRLALRSAFASQREVVRDNVPVELGGASRCVRLTVRPVRCSTPNANLLAAIVQEHAPPEGRDEAETSMSSPGQPTYGGLGGGVDALRGCEERFHLLVESMTDFSTFTLAPDGTVADWNAGAERLEGYRAEEVVGQSSSLLFAEDDRRTGKPEHELQMAAADGRFEAEGWRVRKDGSRFWADVIVRAIRDETGVLRGFAEIVRDITERRRAEQALRESEERLRLAQTSANVGVWERDVRSGRIQWTAELETLYGFAADAFPGTYQAFSERVHPDDRVRMEEQREAAIREHRPFDIDFRVLTLAGTMKWINCKGGAVYDAAGNPERVFGVAIDVTERKRAEGALRESEERLRILADAIPQLVWIARADGYNCWHNKRWYKFTGTTPEQMDGWGWESVLDPKALPRVLERWNESLANGRAFEMEFPLRGTDGRFRRFLTRVVPLRNAKGEVVQWVGTNTDITEIVEMQEGREHVMAELNATIASMIDGVAVYRPDGTISFINPAGKRIMGYSEDDWRGYPSERLRRLQIRREDGSPYTPENTPAARALNGETVQSEIMSVLRADGKNIWLSFGAAPMVTSKGERIGAVGVFSDITESKSTQDCLRRSREGLRRLADASLSVMAKSDLNDMLHAISEAALSLTGARLARCSHGLPSGQYVIGSARAPSALADLPAESFLDRCAANMVVPEGSETIRLRNAGLRVQARQCGLSEEGIPVRGLAGARLLGRSSKTSGAILVADREMGEFTAEDEVLLRQLATVSSLALAHVEARLSLEEADRRKDEFLAMLSHELRNPLAPIRNSIWILQRTSPGGEQARRAQAVIGRQVEHMTRLVDDLLDVTRISRGKVQLRREPLDFADVVRRAVEDSRSVFDSKGVELQLVVSDGPIPVNGDRTRIAEVIGNLLDNASKFTAGGGRVVVSVEVRQEQQQVTVSVSDTGVGIALEMLPRMFEPFTQADTSLDRSKGGLGLGLALVKGLVELHGGTVSVESKGIGKGARFTVRFPLQAERVGRGGAGQGPRAACARQRALLVEEDAGATGTLREVPELGWPLGFWNCTSWKMRPDGRPSRDCLQS